MSYEQNLQIRRALTCPWCDRQGSIVPERDPVAQGLTISMNCVQLAESGEHIGCGHLGVFEPDDPATWASFDIQTAADYIQRWLDSLKGRRPDRGTDQEVEVLRSGIAQMAEQVHGAYHRENGDVVSWRECLYGACATARQLLGID